MKVVIIEPSNRNPGRLHSVMAEADRQLKAHNIALTIDNSWSGTYATADLIIADEPIPDVEALSDVRLLGQRTLNRLQRLQIAVEEDAPVAKFGSPADDDELTPMSQGWAKFAVLKYDWSTRRNGVFLWPLGADRKPFPSDFRAGCDVFMEFLDGDPLTYKIDAFGGVVLASWLLPTRNMRQADWQVLDDPKFYEFAPPPELVKSIARVSKRLLAYGVGYASFDLMQAPQGYQIVEMNTCSVSTAAWDIWPDRYASTYGNAILNTLRHLDAIPKYQELRHLSVAAGNEQAVPKPMPAKNKTQGIGETGAPAAAGQPDAPTGEAALLNALARSDRLPPLQLVALYRQPLAALLKHSFATSPFYRDRLAAMFAADGTIKWELWRDIPMMTRQDIALNRHVLLSRALPVEHGAVSHVRTGGTTGESVTMSRSHLELFVQSTIRARYYQWHQVSPSEKMATLRPEYSIDETGCETWAQKWLPLPHGSDYRGDFNAPPDQQLRWLAGFDPIYLRTTASRARAIAMAAGKASEMKPTLKGILTDGEAITEDVRRTCRKYLNCNPIGSYELTETGPVALQCPASSVYHIQSEVCFVEVVDQNGRVCAPGQIGEIVLTPLYNFAMPLIRLATGDYAEMPSGIQGGPCACGRTLPTIKRVVGSRRNMLFFPGDPPRQPDLNSEILLRHLGATVWQLAQVGALALELRYASSRPHDEADFGSATSYLQGALRPDVTIRFKQMAVIASRLGSKHEDFLCDLPDSDHHAN